MRIRSDAGNATSRGETGTHRAFASLEGEVRGRRWSFRAQMDDRKRWMKKVEAEDG